MTYHVVYLLENVLCALEKNVYSTVTGQSFLYVSGGSSWFIALFKSSISIFCI